MSTALGVGAFLPFQFCTPKKETEETSVTTAIVPSKGTLTAFGIQLNSVKENMAENAVETIKTIAGYGYQQIEGFDGGKGIFWGMKNTEFKSLTDDLGLDFIASHANTFENLEKQASEASTIGMKYLICPYVGPQKKWRTSKNSRMTLIGWARYARTMGLDSLTTTMDTPSWN